MDFCNDLCDFPQPLNTHSIDDSIAMSQAGRRTVSFTSYQRTKYFSNFFQRWIRPSYNTQLASPESVFTLNCEKGGGGGRNERRAFRICPKKADSEPISNFNFTVYLLTPRSLHLAKPMPCYITKCSSTEMMTLYRVLLPTDECDQSQLSEEWNLRASGMHLITLCPTFPSSVGL